MYKYIGGNYDLTDENYYTMEASEHYVSIHTFINYYGTPGITPCQARVINELENPTPATDAMLIGSYIDSYYEGTLEDFKSEHKELFKKDGTLLAKYDICDKMIEKAENDKLFKIYMSGKKQQIYKGEFGGIQWKIKTDNLVLDKNGDIIALVDLKTCKDIHLKYNGFNFIENWGYDYQLAIYQEILKQNIGKYVPCYICAISKEDVPETMVIYIDNEHLENLRGIILLECESFKKFLMRETELQKCDNCDYCKSIRVNDKVINFKDL